MKTKTRRLLAQLLSGLGWLINGCVVCLFLCFCLMMWVMRDGSLGAIESHGVEAFRRWGEGMGEVLLMAVRPLGVGILLCLLGNRLDPRQDTSTTLGVESGG
jgi:hypothetical protein